MAMRKETDIMGRLTVVLVLALMTIHCEEAKAQSGCTSVLISLAPCLKFITGNSTTPSSSCCSQLANVVQSQPQCLCSALSGGASSLGITINQTQALSLPSACHVQTPPVDRCNNGGNGPNSIPVGTPVSAPASPPSESSDDDEPETPNSTSMPTIPSETGSKVLPRTDESHASANIKSMPSYLSFFAVSIIISIL